MAQQHKLSMGPCIIRSHQPTEQLKKVKLRCEGRGLHVGHRSWQPKSMRLACSNRFECLFFLLTRCPEYSNRPQRTYAIYVCISSESLLSTHLKDNRGNMRRRTCQQVRYVESATKGMVNIASKHCWSDEKFDRSLRNEMTKWSFLKLMLLSALPPS
jgi:hypothetical protein